MAHQAPTEKRSTHKGKDLLFGSQLLPLIDPFSEGRQNKLTVTSPESNSFLLNTNSFPEQPRKDATQSFRLPH